MGKAASVPIDGEAVRRVRLEHEMSMTDLARQADMTLSYVNRVELGYSPNVSVDVFKRVRDSLGISHAQRHQLIASTNGDADVDPDREAASAETLVRHRRERVGKEIKAERARRGWNQSYTSGVAGTYPSTWSKLEAGEYVQNRTYMYVDAAFGWAKGRTLAVIDARDELTLAPPPPPSARALSGTDGGDPAEAVESAPLRACMTLVDVLSPDERVMLRDLLNQQDTEDGDQ